MAAWCHDWPMESIDRQILSFLAVEGRMSYTDIGKKTGLSTSAAQQRVRRLEQRGLIKGYSARIDPEAQGLMLTAFVALKAVDPATEDRLPERLEEIEDIASCYAVAGEESYLLVVQVATPADLEAVLNQIRTLGVSTRTSLVLSARFADRPVIAPAQ